MHHTKVESCIFCNLKFAMLFVKRHSNKAQFPKLPIWKKLNYKVLYTKRGL